MNTLDLTCSCGARLITASRYGGDVARERRAFDEAHAACRTASAANRSTPRSRYLVSTEPEDAARHPRPPAVRRRTRPASAATSGAAP